MICDCLKSIENTQQSSIVSGFLSKFTSLANSLENPYTLIFTLFLIGVLGSFSHCISMCGPIAAMQMSNRLINKNSKLKASIAYEYYIGKSITYSILAGFSYLFLSKLYEFTRSSYMIKTIIMLFCLYLAFLLLPDSFFRKKFNLNTCHSNKIINKMISKIKTQNWLMGMAMGLLPCGFLYSSISLAVLKSSNLFVCIVSIFFFGIATFPGLFLISYFGANLLKRYQKFFHIIYKSTILYTIYVLLAII